MLLPSYGAFSIASLMLWIVYLRLDIYVTTVVHPQYLLTVFLSHDAMQGWPSLSCSVCVCVCPSVCLSGTWILSKRINIFKKFSSSGSHSILVFLYQMAWQYSNGNPPNGGVECRWRRQKSWFWANIWLHCLLSMLRLADVINMAPLDQTTVPQVVTLIAGSKWRSLLIARDDNDIFRLRSFNVTPKTTEQHSIARSDKSAAYVTSNKRLCLTFCTVANYWQTRSITRHVCDKRATCIVLYAAHVIRAFSNKTTKLLYIN